MPHLFVAHFDKFFSLSLKVSVYTYALHKKGKERNGSQKAIVKLPISV